MSKAESPTPDQLPPYSEESEEGVLGCILLDSQLSIPRCQERLPGGSSAFYDMRRQRIYQACLHIFESGRPADPISLHQYLKDKGEIEQCGGLAYLNSLPGKAPSAAGLDYFLDVVCDKHTLRRMLRLCSQTSSEILHGKVAEVTPVLDEFERAALAVRQRDRVGESSIKDVVRSSIEDMERWHASGGALPGLPTGLIDLDRITLGMQNGDMIVLAARPSVGKTACSMNIAEHIAIDHHMPTLIYSVEMSPKQLVMRMICSRARVDKYRVHRGQMSENDFKAVALASAAISKAPLHIVDASGLTVGQIRAHARGAKQRHGARLIVVDYLQLVSAKTSPGENRTQEITYISGQLKAMARELDVPAIIVSQLNRASESGAGGPRKPRLSDLRDGGSIEQDADIVVFLFPTESPNSSGLQPVTLDVAKNRNGMVGDVSTIFNRTLTRFVSAARIDPRDSPE
jgi:replicative DNA helicase